MGINTIKRSSQGLPKVQKGIVSGAALGGKASAKPLSGKSVGGSVPGARVMSGKLPSTAAGSYSKGKSAGSIAGSGSGSRAITKKRGTSTGYMVR